MQKVCKHSIVATRDKKTQFFCRQEDSIFFCIFFVYLIFLSLLYGQNSTMNIPTLFHTLFIWYWTISATNARINILNDKSYTPTWAVQLHISATDDDAKFIADSLGLSHQKVWVILFHNP